jgi:hypothetical protein
MKNIKDITISIFAIIGFVAIVTGFNNLEQPQTTTPESHVWEMHLHEELRGYFSINKVTGEVRAYDLRGSDTKNFRGVYSVTTELKR